MPVYNWRDRNARPGSARFFDVATGEELGSVFFWDSDTGRVGRYDRGADGTLRRDPNDLRRLAEIWETRSLRAEWNDQVDAPHVVG